MSLEDRELAHEDFGPYAATTAGITVRVRPLFLEEYSEPETGRYFWAYFIRIENDGPDTVQLMDRYWRIADAMGRIEEVKGPGVVGEQPVLRPGEAYEYNSGCPLGTPSGTMEGHYGMALASGANLRVKIPPFSLDSPYGAQSLN